MFFNGLAGGLEVFFLGWVQWLSTVVAQGVGQGVGHAVGRTVRRNWLLGSVGRVRAPCCWARCLASGALAVDRAAWAPAPLAVGRGAWSGLKFFRGLECGRVFPWFGMPGSAAVASCFFWRGLASSLSRHGFQWSLAGPSGTVGRAPAVGSHGSWLAGGLASGVPSGRQFVRSCWGRAAVPRAGKRPALSSTCRGRNCQE